MADDRFTHMPANVDIERGYTGRANRGMSLIALSLLGLCSKQDLCMTEGRYAVGLKDAKHAFIGQPRRWRNARRMHRPLAQSEIASTRTSRIIGSDSEETAPTRPIYGGVGTEASQRILQETESGPSSGSCE